MNATEYSLRAGALVRETYDTLVSEGSPTGPVTLEQASRMVSEALLASKPVRPCRTKTEAVRQVVKMQMNGKPWRRIVILDKAAEFFGAPIHPSCLKAVADEKLLLPAGRGWWQAAPRSKSRFTPHVSRLTPPAHG